VSAALVQGPFASAALRLHAYGLIPIPCGGDDGKVPGARSKRWKNRPGGEVMRQLVLRFPEANIGILTGPSRLCVVDVDSTDERLVAEMLRRFGITPLMIETPSGGKHLYFRLSGEYCRNLRKSDGLPVDIKATGGFLVVPDSIRLCGEHAGKPYRIVKGAWDEVARLPPIKPGSLRQPARV